MQILLSRYLPFPPFWISLLTGLLFFNNILKYHILNDFNAGLLHVLILMNIFAFFLLKYKRYELKISQKEWQEICTFLKRKFSSFSQGTPLVSFRIYFWFRCFTLSGPNKLEKSK
jgi:predicted permease